MKHEASRRLPTLPSQPSELLSFLSPVSHQPDPSSGISIYRTNNDLIFLKLWIYRRWLLLNMIQWNECSAGKAAVGLRRIKEGKTDIYVSRAT